MNINTYLPCIDAARFCYYHGMYIGSGISVCDNKSGQDIAHPAMKKLKIAFNCYRILFYFLTQFHIFSSVLRTRYIG